MNTILQKKQKAQHVLTKENGKPILNKRELIEETILKVEDATGNTLIEDKPNKLHFGC